MSFTKPYFAGFEYRSHEILKFLQTYTTFTIMLRNGAIVHHQPEHILDFQRWLHHHQIEDVRASIRSTASLVAQQ